MTNCYLKNYLSRSQVREYLSHILDNGTSGIIESPDSVHVTESLDVRLGSTINSIKEYHVSRYMAEPKIRLTQGEVVLVQDDIKPNKPDSTLFVGVVYLSKYGKDYSGDMDNLIESEHNGDIGDVAWTTAENWETATFGATSEGQNLRLVVFWKEA